MTTERLAAVTGASGYLGSRISAGLESRGWRVRRLLRSPGAHDPSARPYRLAEPLDPGTLDSVDLLVHGAYDLSQTTPQGIWQVNVEGTRQLLTEARRAGVRRILVVSTMSAYEGTTQLYGRAKLEIEAAAVAAGGFAIRPGLVYSERPAGMAGALQRITRLPLVPLIAGDAQQFPVHLDDLVHAVAVLAEAEPMPRGPIGVANATPVPFRDLLTVLAALEGRRCRFIAVPWRTVYWALRACERAHLRPPFRADSLLGLVHPAPMVPGADQLARLGISLRPFPSPVHE